MSVDKLKNESLELFPKITSKYNRDNDEKNNIYRINESYENQINKNASRKIALKPLNIKNNKYDPNENIKVIIFVNDDTNKNENKNNKDLTILKGKNIKLKKIHTKNDNILSNDEKSTHKLKKILKLLNSKKPLNKKKHNLLFQRNNSNLVCSNSSNANINVFKNCFSLDNLSCLNETKDNTKILNENQKINDNQNNDENRKKVKFSKSQSKSTENIFLSNINLNSIGRSGRVRKLSGKIYNKKWNLPKVISFDKISGRNKENKNPIKIHYCERIYNYTPNYDLVLNNSQKAYINLGNSNNNLNKIKNYKINATRKYLCNHLNIINNTADYYNIINVINKERERRRKKQAHNMERKLNALEEMNYLINKKEMIQNN